jgi:pSer/pThr/pTyr-binding forkhead associated (FHA) protein
VNRLVYQFEGKQFEIALAARPVSFGRSDEADHKLPTKLASRIHAQVFPRERGWWVEDLASSNGTLVNGNRILKPIPLAPGDVITVGDVALKFEGEPPAPQGPPDHLVARVVYQPGKGKPPIETLIRDRVTIGRKPDNTLQIDDKAVSGHHCELVNRQGAYLMRDLGSSNGTFINKQKVTEHTLRNGDVLVLGKKINVYFIDPAGVTAPQPAAQPAPAGSPPAAPPKLPVKPASSAAGASDRGSFEPIPEGAAAPAANPLPHIGAGVGIGLLCVLVGWLLGSLIGGMGENTRKDPNVREPESALPDAAMSFEGAIDDRGNPEGWSASFEAAGAAKVELLADTNDPFDGNQSLSVSTSGVSGASTLVLQTTQARKLDLGGAFQLTIAIKGEGASKLAISLSALDESGNVVTLAAGSFIGVKGTTWSQFTMNGTVLNPPPESAQLRLLVAGSFTRLWIDRVELTKTADALTTKPFQGIDAPNLSLAFEKRAPAQAIVRSAAGREIRLQPVLLSASDRHQSEDELWAVSQVKPDSVSWTALMASQGDAAAVRFRAAGYDNGYFSDHGLRLDWEIAQGGSGSLAIRAIIPMPPGATIALSDRRGYPMDVDADAVHAYSYSTISELMVNETGISLSFPRGAVAWFDLSSAGELVVTARAANDKERRKLGIDINTRPLMFARMYDRLLNEASRMLEAGHYSAAEVRLEYLTSASRPDKDLPVVTRARTQLEGVQAHRADLLKQVEDTWKAVQATRDMPRVRAAMAATKRYTAEFPRDDIVLTLEDRLMTLETWEIELNKQARTPAEMKEAEASALRLYEDADASFKAGNYLMALVLLDTLAKDFSDTSQMNNATSLRAEIEKKLANPAEQNKVIDAELKRIDEDIKFKDYKDAREKCMALFKRFPDSPRTREIMQRVRQIEDAFAD